MITIEEDRITIYPAIEKIWLTQYQIADTFGVFVSALGKMCFLLHEINSASRKHLARKGVKAPPKSLLL